MWSEGPAPPRRRSPPGAGERSASDPRTPSTSPGRSSATGPAQERPDEPPLAKLLLTQTQLLDQGVVALDKGSLAGCIEDYFERSEQLATRVFIHTDLADKDAPKVAGMFLQVVPTSSEATNVTADSEFEHLCTLTETMTPEELFALPAQDVLHRLYHEQTVEVYAPEAVTFACTCSRERSAEALRNIDKAELLAIIKEEGSINMNCQYCHTEYRFDEIDVEALKSGYNSAPEASQ